MEKNKLQLSLLQIDVSIGQPDMNFVKIANKLEEAVRSSVKPDVIMLPEMWNTGYALDEIQDLADENGSRTKNFLSNFCKEHQVNIVGGSIAERIGSNVRNTIYVFDRQGQITADYSKIHLFRLMSEEKHLVSGTKVGSFPLEDISAGMMVCYDIRFPELTRKLALDGAKILFVPAQWPKPRLHHWRTLLMARAIENQMFVVACNRVGVSGTTDFFGHSMIIDPWGEIIAEGGEQEEIIFAAVDLGHVDKVRAMIPIFEDRRPELY
ncbi:MAG TPA: carbon-nitrogen family hydrolase [Bacilli bacterium]